MATTKIVTRRGFLKGSTTAGLAGILLAWSAAALGAANRPNVLIIMPDQMRGQAMGIAGESQIHTPRIDRLARAGVYLPNTFANTPLCCPARATILTGLYTCRHGVISNDLRLRESTPTMAKMFAEAGYATGFVGKWHLDGGRRMPGYVPPGPRRQGFQFWAANECNHHHFDSIYFHDTDQPIPIKRFEPEVWTDEAIRFIRDNRAKPFLLWWTCGPPHDPRGAPPKYEAMYDPASLHMRPNYKDGARVPGREALAKYYAAITAIDDQVGRLLDTLDELKLAENTIVLFTSDHGDMLGSQGLDHKCKPWEESIRVPGIIRYPAQVKAGQQSEVLFSHVDFLRTLASWCGVPVPAEVQGTDISGILTGGGGEGPPCVLLSLCDSMGPAGALAPWRGVRTKRHVYARFEDRPWVLYDLEQDPYEQKNRVDDPASVQLRTRLDDLLRQEMKRAGDSWSVNLPEHRTYYNGPAVYHPDELKKSPQTSPPR
jgi:arylsulfatase A-like enzyme